MPITTTTTATGLKITGTGAGDSLTGASGNDLILSNGGADTIDGGAGTDTVTMLAARAEYSVAGSAGSFTLSPIHGGGDKLLKNIEAVQFSDGTVTSASFFAPPVNTITGSGAAESLIGSSGADLILSKGGADTIDGGAGSDTVAMLAVRAEYSVVGSAGSFTLTPIHGGGDKILTNIEAVKFTDVTVASDKLFAASAPAPTPSTGGSTPAPGGSIIHMGANQTYKTLTQALGAARDGDVIQVDAGTYNDQSAAVTKSVTIEGVGGLAHFHTTQDIANGKAVLIDQAASLTIRNIEFSGAQVSGGNGAGIRFEKGTLTVQNSFFHDNENGIMGGVVTGGRIIIDHSEFLHNGAGDAQTHSVYAGSIASVSVTNSTFIDANNGIDLKSRAATNDIRNNSFVDSSTGHTTYEIDLPDGHDATITGNVFFKSSGAGNRATIHFGGELSGATGTLSVTNNQFWSDREPTSAILNHTQSRVLLSNNGLDPTVSIPVDVGPSTQQGNVALTGANPVPVYYW